MSNYTFVREKEIEYRFDNVSGPKYLLRGPKVDVGLVVLTPGEDFQAHYHRQVEEDFFTLEGECDIWVAGEKVTVQAGDIVAVPPMEPHYLVNNGSSNWKAVFVKSPYDPKDKVDIEWVPGQPYEAPKE